TGSAASPAPSAPAAAQGVPALLEQGYAHHRAGRLPEAEGCYAAVLARAPEHPEALHHLGLVRHQQGRAAEALELVRRAIALDPSKPRYRLNLAALLAAQGQAREAALARALGWLQAGQPARAEAVLRPMLGTEAEAAGPPAATLHVVLGDALAAQGRADDAKSAYRRAAELAPDTPEPWLGLALLARGCHDSDAALAHLARAEAAAPESARIQAVRANTLVLRAEHDAAVAAFRRTLELAPRDAATHTSLIYCLHYMDDDPPGVLRAESEAWARVHAAHLPRYTDWPNAPDPERTLHLGIVSPDLRAHPDGQFLLALLHHHDRARLRITCYAEPPRPDFMTRELHAGADGWVRIHGWSDAAVAERLRADRVDALLDPTGFQFAHRLTLHARKPVPLQVGKIGYLATRGLPEFDAFLGDALMTPPAVQGDYVERLWPMPPGHLLHYPPPRFAVPVAPPPALAEDADGSVTFGSFNNASKLTPRTLALFAAVLAAVPGSRLYLRAPHLADAGTCARLAAAFAGHGIGAERLRFGGGSDKPTYLADFARVDIHLDTVPNNGVTTTLDALWMGVPVVALWGTEGRSRICATLVTHAGHPEWAAEDADGYVRTAAALAADLARLAAIRAGLRAELEASPLCDGPGYARAVEAALRELWRGWCTGRTGSAQAPAAP
ncbi:MAG TPA: tetratricopeptide repeat protein, partial [bacterium]|nr:tetratricopeptide repeat protein [bacterium]